METRICLIVLFWSVAWQGDSAGEPVSPATAVVELFTSEGCSSCPPADRLLGDLAARKWKKGHVYTLAFHVDYWDRLGWTDRFSDKTFTQRQYRYASSLAETRVYTPQMIVDGRAAFVGSSQTKAMTEIEAALTQADDIKVDLDSVTVSSGVARLRYRLSAVRKELYLNVALVERQTSTDVRAGENEGRVLEHSHVVRTYRVVPVDTDLTGEARVKILDDTTAAALDAIVYVQDRATLAMLGAVSVALKGGD
jgi:hypothetical protein